MTDDLAGLLKGSPRPAVYRVIALPPETAERLRAQGWRVARAAAFQDLDGCYDALAEALGFPAWFGRNLDALWDCLTDLDRPTVLIIEGWAGFATESARAAGDIRSVLDDRTREDPPFAVVLAG